MTPFGQTDGAQDPPIDPPVAQADEPQDPPREQNWVVCDKATGALIGQVITSGSHPRFHGFDWDGETMIAHMSDRQADPAGESFVDGAWAEDAAKIDPRLHAQIDEAAGKIRLRYITDIPGQAMIYLRKETQARAYLAADAPDVKDYSMLAADASAMKIEPAEAARAIVAVADLWTKLACAFEVARLGAKDAVTKAETLKEKEAAAAVDWDKIIEQATQPPAQDVPPAAAEEILR